MKKNIKVEAEGSELILKNKAGDYVIIPKNKRSDVQRMMKDNCHSCIDDLVKTLPTMANYAANGTVIANDGNDPTKPAIRRSFTTTDEAGKRLQQTDPKAKPHSKSNVPEVAMNMLNVGNAVLAEGYAAAAGKDYSFKDAVDIRPKDKGGKQRSLSETTGTSGVTGFALDMLDPALVAGLGAAGVKGVAKLAPKVIPKLASMSTDNILPAIGSKLKNLKLETPEIKYLTQQKAVQARAERMLAQESKWRGQNNSELRSKFENAVENHNPAADFPAEKYGRNTGKSTEVSKDIPVNEANKSRIAAHETGHYYRNTGEEADEWNALFNFNNKKINNKTKVYLKGKPSAQHSGVKQPTLSEIRAGAPAKTGVPHGDELRERAAQLKDYIAEKNNIPLNKDFLITQSQLNDAIKNYVKNTGLDNTMTPFLNAIIDKKGLLKMMNKSALSIVPITGAAAAVAKQSKNKNDKA